MAKIRLDAFLVESGLCESREKAKSCIMSGVVYVEGQKAEKPGMQIDPLSNVSIKDEGSQYVSRGAYKLLKALESFSISPEGKTCIDIGASTGGFTEVLLEQGAKKVYAVDVGYGQLAWKLRKDKRVCVMERTNARYLEKKDFPEDIELAVMDLSFISLELVLPAVKEIVSEGADVICLIKPQFEAGREFVSKRGVVFDPQVHEQVIFKFLHFAAELGLIPIELTYSPIKGPAGNIEFLVRLAKSKNVKTHIRINEVVRLAHEDLNQ